MAGPMNPNFKLLRTAAGYAALALAVSVGGVVVGAAVVAPAVARAKPFVQRVMGEARTTSPREAAPAATHASDISGGSVGQADGDGVVAQVVIAQPYQPMTEVLAASKRARDESQHAPPATGMAAVRLRAQALFTATTLAAAGVPRLVWLVVAFALLLAAGAYGLSLRRRSATPGAGGELSRRSAGAAPVAALFAALPGRLTPTRHVSGTRSRTPKAVAALAEAGAAPADIARRTGLPLDAVAMLLALASFGGRQLQPPTA